VERYDVLVLGGGSAGAAVAVGLAERDRTVALVEPALVGGECPYLACMPSKALLHAAGAGRDWSAAVRFRDDVAEHRDDSGAAKSLAESGVTVVRGRAVITGPGAARTDDRELTGEHLVIATGAEAVLPPVDGLADVDPWTSADALSSDELPSSLVILGGGPVGCELAQVYARFGATVTVIEPADRLLPAEPPVIGETVAAALRRDAVEVMVGKAPRAVAHENGCITVHLADGGDVAAARILVAAGKKPRLDGLGLDAIGVTPDDDGVVPVDDRCCVTDGVWAAGDVTGVAPFTHMANYQANVVVANICGEERRTDDRAIPRVVYTDPAVFCVGRTDDDGLRTATFPLEETARAVVAERRDGSVTLVADGGRLVGAACVGPEADHWGAELTLAVRAGIGLDVLRDVVHAFPTFSEALGPVYDELCKGSSDEGTW
jgi:pyruvate/2-oxoglutarate dehydrogenase complex dihydrolipoamide dehydrogenase (E3) component